MNDQNNYFGLGPILIQKLKMADRLTSQNHSSKGHFLQILWGIFTILIAQWDFYIGQQTNVHSFFPSFVYLLATKHIAKLSRASGQSSGGLWEFLRIWSSFVSISLASKYLQANF